MNRHSHIRMMVTRTQGRPVAVGTERLLGDVTTNRAIYADKALSVGCRHDRSESGGDRGHPR